MAATFETFDTTSGIKFQSRNRRKQCLIAGAVILVSVVALTVGLAVGLRDKGDAKSGASYQPPPAPPRNYPVLLISLDGFRASYLSYNATPHLDRLLREGVHTRRMLPVYPTRTFPNHYTIVTGLYPESHGIVDNDMFDVHLNESYYPGSLATGNKSWYGGEPIWQTAQKQGKRSACYFWVGSDVDINDMYPDWYFHYNGSVPWSERVDTVVQWLSMPADQRPDIITLYYEEPDYTGHVHGPGLSPDMLSALKAVDDGIGRLIQGLETRDLYNSVNIIVVSDHGMAARSCSRQVKLSDYLTASDLAKVYVYSGAAGRISNKYTAASRRYTVLDQPLLSTESLLQRLSAASQHMTAYDKRHLPARLHYANNHRIDDIILLMDNEWVVNRNSLSGSSCSGGTHGWDSRYETMSALFIARGPAFNVGQEVPPFENIQLYSMIADLLNITAAPNNGTRGALHHALKNPPTLKLPQMSPGRCDDPGDMAAADIDKYCNCSTHSPQNKVLRFQQQASTIGQPLWPDSPSAICLAAADRTTVYSPQIHMPLWTAFTITTRMDILQDSTSCVVAASSLPPAEQQMFVKYTNQSLGVSPAAMFASTSRCGTVSSSADVLPITDSLKEDLWQELWLYLKGWMAKPNTGPVSITLGPVFDYNFDGLADNLTQLTRFVDSAGTVPLPSHYFAVLIKCHEEGQVSLAHCANNIDILSFILPNEQPSNGRSADYRLMENEATLRDVELLTGLRFLSDLHPATSARLRTQVPDVWATSTDAGSWTDNFVCPASSEASQCSSSYKPLVLISLDGFRADYLVKYNRTPVIDRLIKCGVHAPYMRSVYPTLTFPNHYSIVTGLYPESHGIIDNNMYDLDIKEKFFLGSPNTKIPAWWGGEPLWLTAQRQGKRAATFFWPGSDVPIQGEYPNYYRNYSGSVTYSERVNTLLKWLLLSADKRPDFLTLYFSEPDHIAHEVGPDNFTKVAEQLAVVDAAIGDLMQGLYLQNMLHCVNVIIVADHGMSSLSCDRMVVLSADLSQTDLNNTCVYEGPVGRISNKYGYGRDNNYLIDPPRINISTIVEKLECGDTHIRVFTKEGVPMRLHYTNNKRIDDVILDADDQWVISRSGSSSSCFLKGNHGYDNLYASMHALFLAYGPAFKSGVEVPAFENIELYNLMSDLVGVKPAPNNGTEGTLFDILLSPPLRPQLSKEVLPDCASDDSQIPSLQEALCHCSHQTSPNLTAALGIPEPAEGGLAVCLIRRAQHIIAYNHQVMGPAWAIFNVSLENSTNATSNKPVCVIRDPFLENSTIPTINSTLLQGTAYVPASLLFGYANSCHVAMSSEMVPMLKEFVSGTWRDLKQLVADYSAKYGDIAVTVGPVYNDDVTGLWHGRTNKTKLVNGVPVPTHFFVVLATDCSAINKTLRCWDDIQLLSFLIPHVAVPSNCQNFSAMLREHVARVRDIEIATGLEFFSEFPLSRASQMRTFLPTEVWDGSPLILHTAKPGHWQDQACPPSDYADSQCPDDYKPVLLISLDGFKPQYLGRGLTPTMDKLLSCGVHAPFMRSVYPTKTFPNHYTITSGLYPESHGIIDNSMFDFNISSKGFSISSSVAGDPRWWGGDPIWLTSQRQNKSAASFFWVGSDVAIQGSYPDIFKFYSGAVSFSSRVSTVVQWMRLPAERRPDFIMLYFDEPDHTAHTFGPFTHQVDDRIKRVDGILGDLMDSLYQHSLHHCVNLMVVSDHGFSSVSCDKVVELNKYLNGSSKSNNYYYYGPFGRIGNTYHRLTNGTTVQHPGPPPMTLGEIQNKLPCLEHMKVYVKTDLPKRHHYANNQRIDGIILDLAMNWTVTDKLTPQYCTGGSHGWDNTYKAMEALFLGYGPAFKNVMTVKPFENIELYNLMSDILQIQPSPNNGTEGSLDHLLWRTFNRTRQALSEYNSLESDNVTYGSVSDCYCPDDNTSSSIELALNSQNVTVSRQKHLPFGAPLLMSASLTNATILYQPTSVTAYSRSTLGPLWVSATVNSSMRQPDGDVRNTNCTVLDPRISASSCEQLNQTAVNHIHVSLLPLGYNLGETSSLLSTFIPMHETFYTAVWLPLQTYLSNWSIGYLELNIVAGPAYDVNNDAIADSDGSIRNGIPTDVFLVATRCENQTVSLQRCQYLQTLTFLLPQVDSSKQHNCQTVYDYLVDNEARVRDAELLTGLQFFPELPFTQAVAMRTYLPSGLW